MLNEETDVLDSGAVIIIDDAAPLPCYQETAQQLGWEPLPMRVLSYDEVLKEVELYRLTAVNESCTVVVKQQTPTEEAPDGSSRSVNECSNEQEVQQVRD